MTHLLMTTLVAIAALGADANYDESKVPSYTLPDPLVGNDGTPVTDAKTWETVRRPEVLKLMETYMYGKMPPAPEKPLRFEVLEQSDDALGGIAVRRQVRIFFTDQPEPAMDLLIYRPKTNKPVPAFLALNFVGNQSIQPDEEITICRSWVLSGMGIVDHRATEASRGARASRWQVEMIVKRGYALATVCCGDIDPDFDDGYRNGIHPLIDPMVGVKTGEGETRPGDAPSTITAWSWGLSRVLDHLIADPAIDGDRVALLGHSRLGKTSLWAGANDPRFAIVVSNNSGCGGAALSRREYGETIDRITTVFPHWFCGNLRGYATKIGELPVDQHMLTSLIAPRPLYVASAEGDRWADPRGEFLSALGANPVYKLLGTEGLPATEMPQVDQPVVGRIGYHMRTGKHDVTEFDWQQYLDFADKHLGKP